LASASSNLRKKYLSLRDLRKRTLSAHVSAFLFALAVGHQGAQQALRWVLIQSEGVSRILASSASSIHVGGESTIKSWGYLAWIDATMADVRWAPPTGEPRDARN
jgi:hypothetical protein